MRTALSVAVVTVALGKLAPRCTPRQTLFSASVIISGELASSEINPHKMKEITE